MFGSALEPDPDMVADAFVEAISVFGLAEVAKQVDKLCMFRPPGGCRLMLAASELMVKLRGKKKKHHMFSGCPNPNSHYFA